MVLPESIDDGRLRTIQALLRGMTSARATNLFPNNGTGQSTEQACPATYDLAAPKQIACSTEVPVNFKSVILIGFILLAPCVLTQTDQSHSRKTTAERLGYPADSRLLILHADDFGMAHSVNRATIEALEKGWVTSASILVPCAWFPEVARWAHDHPDADLGVHLTLNSEWANYRWRPLSMQAASSLTDSQGYLPTDASYVNAHATPADAEMEARAQIDAAVGTGIKISHLDTHMLTFLRISRLFKIYWKLGQQYNLPVVMGKGRASKNVDTSGEILYADTDIAVNAQMLPVDHVLLMNKNVPTSDWLRNYENMLSPLRPGTYELILHLGYNDEELQGMTEGHTNWGAQWRQNDLDVVRSPEFRKFLKDQNFILVSWREVAKAIPTQ